MRTRHVVHGSSTMSFQMESGDVLRVRKCVMGSRSVFSASIIEEKGYAILFWDGQALPRGSSSDTTMVLELERAMCIGRRANLCKP
jgi:hypothetical protein